MPLWLAAHGSNVSDLTFVSMSLVCKFLLASCTAQRRHGQRPGPSHRLAGRCVFCIVVLPAVSASYLRWSKDCWQRILEPLHPAAF